MKPVVAIFSALLSFSMPPAARADGPLAQIRSTVQSVLSVLDAGLEPAAEEQKLREIASRRFDFEEMARRSLGPQWNRLTPEEQSHFVRLFKNLVVSRYIDRIRELKNEKVVYIDERIDGDFARVESRMIPTQGKPISLDYRLRSIEGEWRVYDVAIEHVSLVSNYPHNSIG